jgi:hypothetical protein
MEGEQTTQGLGRQDRQLHAKTENGPTRTMQA